jgi:hypothetical protein
MRIPNLFFALALMPFITSCYQEANIKTISHHSPSKIVSGEPVIYQYRVGGLQKMSIRISRKKGFFSDGSIDLLTDHELSKLKVSINPLSHEMGANGKRILSGTTSSIDLRKDYTPLSWGGSVVTNDYITSAIEVASYPDDSGRNTLCDFIITIEDRGGITPGLSLSGGFKDGF